jgi:hypothetical protein
MEQYSKYKDGGLRQKLHDAIRARNGIRCMATGHLRSNCSEPPKSWEEDFNKGKADFWGPKVKQSRPQLLHHTPDPQEPQVQTNLLVVRDGGLRIALDTCSEISIGRKKKLKNLRLVENPIFVQGIGGMLPLEVEGDFLLAGKIKITVFCVRKRDLPPNTEILLKSLPVSLDFVMLNPQCRVEEAMKSLSSSSPFASRAPSPEVSSREMEGAPSKQTFLFGLLSLLVVGLFGYGMREGRLLSGESPSSFETVQLVFNFVLSVFLGLLVWCMFASPHRYVSDGSMLPPFSFHLESSRLEGAVSLKIDPRLHSDVREKVRALNVIHGDAFAKLILQGTSPPPLPSVTNSGGRKKALTSPRERTFW